MEKQVIFRDRQELQSADLNNTQAYTADSLVHLRQDAVSAGQHFTGGVVSAASATEILVASVRYYNDGAVYVSEAEETLNLFQYLPLVTRKCVAVVLWGQAVDTQVEPRDMLVDLTTGATQPQAVALQRLNRANINLVPGSESADPQPPVIQTNTLAIALVYLAPTGIERIEMQERARLPQLQNVAQRLLEHEAWRAQAEPRIASIATDLSALASKSANLAQRSSLMEMALDLGRVKARLNLPADYAAYDSDYYANATKTDPLQPGHAAQVGTGLLFPTAAQGSAPLALFNPYDAAIHRTADDLVLPAHTSVARIKTAGYAGDVSLSQYQVQTHQVRKYQVSVYDYHYGTHCNYQDLWYYYHAHGGTIFGWTGNSANYLRTQRTETHYQLETVTTNYNGAVLAQTLLVANAMWATRLGLAFTEIAAAGDVVVILCETEGGKPVLERSLAVVTVPRADLRKYPEETLVPLPPVLLEAGRRYAIALVTQGAHRAATVSGNNYTQGTLFYGSDGDYFTGDLTRDLMFTLYGAQFAQPRTEVMLQPVSLAGGISDLAISAQTVEPAGTQLRYEIQIAGKWYEYGDNVNRLADLPDIVPLRAVFLGTQDLAPAVRMAANALRASRPASVMTHWSALRTLTGPSSHIEVQVVVAQWDQAHHTLACSLVDGATTVTPSSTVVRDEPGQRPAKRFIFTFNPGAPLTTYRIRLSGTRTGDAAPFVTIERTDVAL